MNKNVIFIAGVHGVGKSTIVKNISKELDIDSYTASDIINGNKYSLSNNKKVDKSEIKNNQDLLVDGLKKYRNNRKILLDGHFVLFSENDEIVKIPFENYLRLNLSSIIVLINTSENICKNLRQRDKKNYSIKVIEKMQNYEIEYAKEVSNQLKINISIFHVSEQDKILSTIKSIIEGRN